MYFRVSDTLFLRPSIPSKWSGLRELVMLTSHRTFSPASPLMSGVITMNKAQMNAPFAAEVSRGLAQEEQHLGGYRKLYPTEAQELKPLASLERRILTVELVVHRLHKRRQPTSPSFDPFL